MAQDRLKLAVFISGRGSNMEALLKACRQDDYPATIAVVLSNRADAAGLETAANEGVATEVVDHKQYGSREDFEAEIAARLEKYDIDLICLAGFMRLLSPSFVEPRLNGIINIHPSLLPLYKGLHTHERVLEDGCTETGCTVHFVRPAMDDGPVIVQKKVAVKRGDTPEALAERVLEQEHEAYVEAVRLIGAQKITISNEQVEIVG